MKKGNFNPEFLINYYNYKLQNNYFYIFLLFKHYNLFKHPTRSLPLQLPHHPQEAP